MADVLAGRSDSGGVARAWFIGANPFLDEETPLTAIREDRARQVVAAATAFVEASAHA